MPMVLTIPLMLIPFSLISPIIYQSSAEYALTISIIEMNRVVNIHLPKMNKFELPFTILKLDISVIFNNSMNSTWVIEEIPR